MKKIYIILTIVVLLGLGGGFAFWLTKEKKKESKSKLKNPSTTAPVLDQKPVLASTIKKELPTQEAINFDIKVSNVDTQNRRFDYEMHYKGIQHKGSFEEGVTGTVQIKKAFGSFLIAQAFQAMQKEDNSIASKGAAQKVRGGKGAKMNNTDITPIKNLLKNNEVNLSIMDNKGQVLKLLNVNLATGQQKTSNLKSTTVLRTI
jgi:hypothetical protein